MRRVCFLVCISIVLRADGDGFFPTQNINCLRLLSKFSRWWKLDEMIFSPNNIWFDLLQTFTILLKGQEDVGVDRLQAVLLELLLCLNRHQVITNMFRIPFFLLEEYLPQQASCDWNQSSFRMQSVWLKYYPGKPQNKKHSQEKFDLENILADNHKLTTIDRPPKRGN